MDAGPAPPPDGDGDDAASLGGLSLGSSAGRGGLSLGSSAGDDISGRAKGGCGHAAGFGPVAGNFPR
eukprot:3918144-Pyramimonas_sp.AAC.1